jgi:alpha-beta hydrolase superfamily lysophospholipase
MRWSVLTVAPDVKVPMLLAHGECNELHPPEQAEALRKVYGGEVEHYPIEGAGHTEWMADDNPTFQALCERMLRWLEEQGATSRAARQ